MKILQNVLLKDYTTFRLGGPARFFIEVITEEEIGEAIKFAQQKALPFLILGRGSNLIFADEGYQGVIIYPQLLELRVVSEGVVYAGASVLLDDLVDWLLEKKLSGFEWAAGIPGTLGGAIYGNAGANGGETSDVIKNVRYMSEDGKIGTINNKESDFGYRTSVFKKKNWMILGVEIRVIRITNDSEYRISEEKIKKYRGARKEKHPLEYPSAGSVFKNVPVEEIPEEYQKKFKQSVKTDPMPVVPAAKIIAEAGLSGLRIGDAQISEKHTNFIINLRAAKTKDVLGLIKKIQSVVKEKFGVELSVEPIIVKSA